MSDNFNKIEYKNLIAFHPGYYLMGIIVDMGITQDEFAKRLGTSGKNLSNLLNGKANLSKELALNLSIMLGTSADIWLNLQKTYNEKVLEIERRKKLDEEVKYLKVMDYDYFVKIGAVPMVKEADSKVEELLRWMQAHSLSVLEKRDFLVSCRAATANISAKNIINSNAWVQTAINRGRGIETALLDLKKLEGHLSEIRSMTLKEPDIFLPILREIFNSCGVAFVLLPHLKNSAVNGAVKWINKEKVILAMNDRRLYADTFWFSLFHEIGHVFQRKIKMLIVNMDHAEMDEIDKELEEEANEFARSSLIPPAAYQKFIEKNNFTEPSIVQFSEEIGIHPGIVVGRLQKDERISYRSYLNSLKEKYRIVS